MPAFVPALLVFAGYYGGACLGLALTTVMSPASVLWVPGAVLFGALLVAPPHRWGPFVASAIAAHLRQPGRAACRRRSSSAAWSATWPKGWSAASSFAGSSPAILFDRQPALRRALIAAAVVAAVVSSLLNSAFVTAVEWKSAGQSWAGWPARMFASTLASLVVVPLLAAWSAERAPWRSWDLPRRLEAALLVLVLAASPTGSSSRALCLRCRRRSSICRFRSCCGRRCASAGADDVLPRSRLAAGGVGRGARHAPVRFPASAPTARSPCTCSLPAPRSRC
jgi:hypothetical protein